MEAKCDALAALSRGLPPGPQKISSELNRFKAAAVLSVLPKTKSYAAMTSLQSALGAISMFALGGRSTLPGPMAV